MANVCETTITVIGLTEAPETFVKALSSAMFGIDLNNLEPDRWSENHSVDGKTWYVSLVNEYRQHRYAAKYCILYPHEPYNRLGVAAPRFYVETKWEPPINEIREASKAFPDLTFHLDWWVEQDGPSGQRVIRNGNDIDEICRPASCYLFDHALLYPRVSLLPAHIPFTLAQRGVLRLEDAIQIIEDLRGILDDDRFKNSSHTPFSDCRDKQKTEKLQAGLAALHESMVEQVTKLDFSGVFLEEQELPERYLAVVEANKALMETLGLELLLPAPGAAARFSILPFQVAIIEHPYRVVLPVLHYTNADPISGRYQKGTDGTTPPIAWELRYACLTPSDTMQIRRLPDEDQTPFDVDFIMTNASDRHFGYDLYRASTKALWRLDAELVKEVDQKAIEMASALAARVAGKSEITILDDFEAAEATLFPKRFPPAALSVTGADTWKQQNNQQEKDSGNTRSSTT